MFVYFDFDCLITTVSELVTVKVRGISFFSTSKMLVFHNLKFDTFISFVEMIV